MRRQAGVGQGVGGGDGPEAFAPAGQQHGGLELLVGLVDARYVDADRAGQVDPDAGALGEGLPEPSFAQSQHRQLDGVYGVAVAGLVVAGQGHPAQALGAFLEHGHQVGEHGVARGVVLVEDPEGRRQHGHLGVGERCAPVQADQGGQQVETPSVGVGQQLAPGAAG